MELEGFSLDEILWGRLKLYQPLDGPRISMDSVLLQGFARVKRGQSVLELGSATGGVLLMLALRFKGSPMVGLEIDGSLVEVARLNASMNGVDGISFVEGDIRRVKELFKPQSFDVVVSNPPYQEPSSSRMALSERRATARHGKSCSLEDVVEAARFALKNRGRFFAVMKANRSVELLSLLSSEGLEPKRLLFVHPRPKTDAILLLVEAMKEGGRGVRVEEPLFVEDEEGRYTERLLSFYGGEGPWRGS